MLSLRFVSASAKLARRLSSVAFQSGASSSVSSTATLTNQLANLNITPLSVRSNIVHLDITPPAWSNNKHPAIENPLVHTDMEDPSANAVKEIMDKITDMPHMQDLEMPTGNSGVGDEGIQAAVMIGIRRRKMKKHKLKKLRKKMRFDWAKVRQRRELRKEKAFQAVLISQIKEAEKFSAEAYVSQKLRQANETPLPRFWKGKRLPEFLIREKLGLKQ